MQSYGCINAGFHFTRLRIFVLTMKVHLLFIFNYFNYLFLQLGHKSQREELDSILFIFEVRYFEYFFALSPVILQLSVNTWHLTTFLLTFA